MPEQIENVKFSFIGQIAKDSKLKNEIAARFKATADHYSGWNDEAKEDYKFAMGDQWDEVDRQALADQGRPCLTFNRIRPLINIVAGYQRENSSRIKVNPEGGEDSIFSEVMDRAIKAVDKWSHLNYKMGYWFDDGCYVGKGWLEAVITYDRDPVRGELRFKQRTPYQIMPDPDCKEYDLNEGHKFCFKIQTLKRSELLDLYPKKKKIIDNLLSDSPNDDPETSVPNEIMLEGSDDDYENNPNATTAGGKTTDSEGSGLDEDTEFVIKEYWKPKKVTKYFVINKEDGVPEKFDTEEEANVFINKQSFGKIIERRVPEMWVFVLCAGWILQEEQSPFEPHYSGYPFFRNMGDWAPNAEDEITRVQGIVRPLKDPQREKNKAKSQNLHILNTQANSGWIGDDDALLPDDWIKLEQLGAKAGLVIKKKKGSELREILPKGPNAGQLQREEKADSEFTQISTINPDLLGFQEGTQSGKAIGMRIKQAILSLARLFSNYKYSKEILGNFILQMIPMLFDTNKLMRLLGPEYMRKTTDPEKYPEGITEGHIEAFLIMVKDHRFDVLVSEAGDNNTVRYEIFQELAELLKAGAPVPIDLLIEYMDLPNSKEVLKRIKEQQEQQTAAMMAAKGKPAGMP